MPEDLAGALGRNIPLSEMIESLRRELAVAVKAGEGQSVRFEVKKIQVELQIAITRNKGGDGRVSFGVVSFGGNLGKAQQDTHVFRLELEAQYRGEDGTLPSRPPLLGGTEPTKPDQGKRR